MVNINPNIKSSAISHSYLNNNIVPSQKPEVVNGGNTEVRQISVENIVTDNTDNDVLRESRKDYPGGSMQDVVNDLNNGNYDKTGQYGNLSDGWAYIIVIDDNGNAIVHFHTGQYKPGE